MVPNISLLHTDAVMSLLEYGSGMLEWEIGGTGVSYDVGMYSFALHRGCIRLVGILNWGQYQ